MTAFRALAALSVLLLALTGCVPEHPFVEAPADPWARDQATLDSLTAAGRLEPALALARRRVRAAQAGLQPRTRLASAIVDCRALERRARMPREQQDALTLADAELLRGVSGSAADSLADNITLLRDALRLRLAVLGPDDPSTAAAAYELGDAAFFVGRAREADSLAHVARTVFIATYGPVHPRVADTDQLLGRIVRNFGGSTTLAQALDYDARSLRTRVACEGPNSLSAASSYHLLGNLNRSARRPAQAFQCFQASLEIKLRRLGPLHEDVASAWGGMAFLALSRGNWAQAEALVSRALAASPDSGRFTTSRNTRMGLRGQMLRRMGRTLDAIAVLNESAAMSESLWKLTPQDGESTISSGLSIHAELALALAAQGDGEGAFVECDRGSSRTLLARVLAAGAVPDSVVAEPWRDLRLRAQRWLADDAAIVVWPHGSVPYSNDYPLWACVVRRTGPVQWFRLDRRTPLYKQGFSIREVLWGDVRAAAEWPRRVTDVRAIRDKARWMYRDRFAPLEPALAGVRHLIVCSQDYHCGGPLGVLLDEQGRWLVDRYAISYSPSVLLWVLGQERADHLSHAPRSGALLVGDPLYPAGDPGHWQPLHGAAEEIRTITPYVEHANVLTGADASASRLRALAASGALGRFALLHFGTHTLIDLSRVMESALVLAPDAPGGANASLLRAREVLASWKLGADLVSLAGCQSVRGGGSASEGPLGLSQAFLGAGARSVLVSLWPVDDAATSLLMKAFYRRLAQGGPRVDRAEALAGAQRELRETRDANGRTPYAHPAYWTAFMLIGDPN